jgi:hypothetical protein
VSRCAALREAGYVPVSEDGRGVSCLGDRTRGTRSRRSVDLSLLRMEAAATRVIDHDYARRRSEGSGDALTLEAEAEYVLSRLAAGRGLDEYEIVRRPQAGGGEAVELRLNLDGCSVVTRLRTAPGAAGSRPVLATATTRSQPDNPVFPQPSQVRRAADLPLRTDPGPGVTARPARRGIGDRLRVLFEQVFHGRSRRAKRGDPNRP